MRKTLHLLGLFALLFLGGGNLSAQTTVTFTAETDVSSNTFITKGGIEVQVSNGTFSRKDNYRVYKSATIKLISSVGNITKVVFTCTSSNPASNLTNATAGTYVGSTGTWTGDTTTFTLTSSVAQTRITKIEVTYTPSGKTAAGLAYEPTSATFTLGDTFTQPTLANPNNLTVTYSSSAEAVATVAEDGTITPVAAGTAVITASSEETDTYAAGTATYTLTVQKKLELTGDGTEANPYTVADVLALYENNQLPSDSVYVKGIISTITSVDTGNYGNATYYISDDGTTTNQLQVFRGKWLGGNKFTSSDQIAVGGTVVICGLPVLYNNKTQEITTGSRIVTYTAPAVYKPTITGETAFLESTSFTLTSDGADAIYYTLDGTEPTDASTKYDGNAVTLTETTVVKAIAYKGTTKSDVVTKKFTKGMLTVEEATTILTNNEETSDEVFVMGTVSQIDEITTSYGNATYYISVDGTTNGQLEVFRGKDFGDKKFTNTYALEVGDKVLVCGVLTNYVKNGTTTQEIAKSYIVRLATEITIGSTGYATAYYSGKNLTVPEGVTATTYNVSNNTLAASTTYNAGDVIPAGEGVVLKGDVRDYDFDVVASSGVTKDSNNLLLGTDKDSILVADANSYFFKLTLNAKKETSSIGFYWGADDGAAFTNGAHKAYLKVAKSEANNAKAFLLDGNATGIENLTTKEALDEKAPMYNLSGQRVNVGYRGVVIQNGRKYLNDK